MHRIWAAALAAALGALLGACRSAPAVDPASTAADARVSGAVLADELGLIHLARTDRPVVELVGPDESRVLLFPGTTTVSVDGVPFETAAPIGELAGDAILTADDAATIRALWWGAVADGRRDGSRVDLPDLPDPLPRATRPVAAAPSGASGGAAPTPSRGLRAPTSAERSAWGVRPKRTWSYLVIHHSGTDTGSAASFHRSHKERGWDGLGYHFVIGNGRGTSDGQIEVGYRWREQRVGAHAGNRTMNDHGIGICLVGNFEKDRPTARQMESLTRLCRFLAAHCGIAPNGVKRHEDVRKTPCPGRLFPEGWTYLDDPAATASRRN